MATASLSTRFPGAPWSLLWESGFARAPSVAAILSSSLVSEELQETLEGAKGVWLLLQRPMAVDGLAVGPGGQRMVGVALKCEEVIFKEYLIKNECFRKRHLQCNVLSVGKIP